jgi:thiamine kinase-like enzyme
MREERLELGGRPFACADIWLLYEEHVQHPYGIRKDYRDTDMAYKVAEREMKLYRSGIVGPFAEKIQLSSKSLTLRYIDSRGSYDAAMLMSSIASLHICLSTLNDVPDNKNDDLNFDFFNPMHLWFEKVIEKLSRIPGYLPSADRAERQLADIFVQLVSQKKSYVHGDMCPNNIRCNNGQLFFIDFECLSLGPVELDLVLPYKMLLQTGGDCSAYENLAQIYYRNGGIAPVDKENIISSMIFDLFRRINCYANNPSFDMAANAVLLEKLVQLHGLSVFADMPEGNPYTGQTAFLEWVTS